MRPLVYRYEIGQKLLCFEPDVSKAKLIYFAKILKHVQKSNSDIPYYAVHFHGWKCKWDREVPEHLLLENTDFNRMLKKKIDELARTVRSRHKRKQRIDTVLEFVSISGDNIDWDNIPGIVGRGDSQRRKLYSTGVRAPSSFNRTISDKCGSITSDDQEDSLSEEELTQLQYENLQFHLAFAAPINLPDKLQSIVHRHSMKFTNHLNADTIHRGWCSVLQVLQSYVDRFPFQDLKVPPELARENPRGVACSERVIRFLGPAYAKIDQNRLICADVCVSLRVLFDSIFYSHLLLPDEKLIAGEGRLHFYHMGCSFSETMEVSVGAQPVFRYSSPRYELLLLAEAENNPELPCLNYPAHFLLRLFVNLSNILDAMDMTLCRRSIVTHHLYMFLQYLDQTAEFWFTPSVPKFLELTSVSSDAIITGDASAIRAKNQVQYPPTQSCSGSSGATEPQTARPASFCRTRQSNRSRPPPVSSISLVPIRKQEPPDVDEKSSTCINARLRKLRSPSHEHVQIAPSCNVCEVKPQVDTLKRPRTAETSPDQLSKQPKKKRVMTSRQEVKPEPRHIRTRDSSMRTGPVLRSKI